MLVNDDFILLNLPKTGSSFTRKVLKEVHEKIKWDIPYRLRKGSKKPILNELLLPNIRAEFAVLNKDQHGTYQQIPKEYLNSDRKVISVFRDPVEAYISRYYFQSYKWVAKNNVEFSSLLTNKIPSFPEISFDEYLNQFTEIYLEEGFKKMGIPVNKNIGLLTFQFIHFFAKDPIAFFSTIQKQPLIEIELNQYFPNIHFLFNETLAEDIYNCLHEFGYADRHIRFIKNANKENVTKREKSNKELLTIENLKTIQQKDELLYIFFPAYKLRVEELIKDLSKE